MNASLLTRTGRVCALPTVVVGLENTIHACAHAGSEHGTPGLGWRWWGDTGGGACARTCPHTSKKTCSHTRTHTLSAYLCMHVHNHTPGHRPWL